MLTLSSPILTGFFKTTKPKNGKRKGSKDKAASCVSAAYTKAMEHDLSSRPEYQQVTCAYPSCSSALAGPLDDSIVELSAPALSGQLSI